MPVLLGGARVVAGQPQVLRAAVAAPSPVAQQRLGHAPVQQPPARAAGLLVDELAQLAVGEVVGRLGGASSRTRPRADELVEAVGRLLVAAAARRAHGVEAERAPDHRRGLEQLARGRVRARRRAPRRGRASRAPASPPSASAPRYSATNSGSPSLSAKTRRSSSGRDRARAHELADLRLVEAARASQHRRRSQPAQPVPGRHAVAAPREQQQQRPAAQPPRRGRRARRASPRRRRGRRRRTPTRRDAEHRGDALEQPRLRAGPAHPRRAAGRARASSGAAATRRPAAARGTRGERRRPRAASPSSSTTARRAAPPRPRGSARAQHRPRRPSPSSSRASRDLPIPASPSITASRPSGAGRARARRAARRARRRARRAAARRAARPTGAADRRRAGAGGDERPLAHLLEQRRGLVHRADAELLAERAHAVAVLGERGRAVAVERVEADQLAVRGLVQRVEREPALRVADRACRTRRASRERAHQAPERRAELALQRVGLVHVPGVERRAVAQREALEQLAAEDLDGARRARRRRRPRAPGSAHVDVELRARRAARRCRPRCRPTPRRPPCAAPTACAAARRARARGPGRATAARTAPRASAGARPAPGGRAAPSPCACRTRPARRRGGPAADPAARSRVPAARAPP